MGKVPDFTKVFIVGFLMFFGFYLLIGNFQLGGEGPGYRFIPSTRNQTTAEPEITTKGDFVGTKEVEDFRHIALSTKSFVVSYITEEKSFIEIKNFRAESGIFGANEYEKVFSLTEDELSQLSSTKLYGEIEDTNLYGRLVVGLNGEKIFSDFVMPGEAFEIPLNKSLFRDKNEFLVTSESSGWRIWAPTVYIIKQLEVKSDFMGEVSQSFDFYVSEEETPLNMGRIILNFDEINGEGNLIVRVNGNLVFNNTPTLIQWIEIENCSSLVEGKNTVEMVSEKDTEFTVRNAEIIIFWNREAKENLEMTIDLTSSQRDRLPGEIKFKLEKVFGTPTSLVATIEDPDGNKHSVVVEGVLQEGRTVTIDLPKDYTGVGKNKIIFSVTGSGGYTITDFRVNL